MAIDQRAGTKVIKSLRREEAGASRVDPYPYIGIVKNNLDPTRSGRLQIYIPDLGGDEKDQTSWRTVSYASPFMGYTTNPNTADTANAFESVTHTYGMWMVPPDIGVQVIALFIAGDPLRGYWVACVNPNLSHHMIPGLAGSTNVDLGPTLKGTANVLIPVAEFNENLPSVITNSSFRNLPKPIHTEQYGILKVQGLDRDSIRGSISSSSQRETPSAVFGISTPGRPLYAQDPANPKNDYVNRLNTGTLPPDFFKIKSRQGGHTFVMDDGATLGENQLVRLRTAGGHQVLMHDSANTLYISHKDGTSWVELTTDGQIKIFSQGNFSVRSEGTINLHSDASINLNAANNINLNAGGKIQAESSSTTLLTGSLSVDVKTTAQFKIGGPFKVETSAGISLKAAQTYALEASQILNNSGGTLVVSGVDAFKLNNFPDTSQNNDLWINRPNQLSSIVTVAPTHEPYARAEAAAFFNPENASTGITPQATYTGAVDAIKGVAGTEVKDPAGTKDLRNQPVPNGTVGNLSKDQMTAYLAQIGASESRVGTTKGVGNGKSGYECQNELGFIGKYQFGYQALIDQGYVKSSVTSLAQLDNPNSWTGKDGISDKNAWFSNGSVQESAMLTYTQTNYTRMVSNGAITADMPPEDVGGMLAASHLLGAGGANTWRKTGSGKDALGSTGAEYFQKGKFAISVLAPQVPAVAAG
jgi:hypothetical protein